MSELNREVYQTAEYEYDRAAPGSEISEMIKRISRRPSSTFLNSSTGYGSDSGEPEYVYRERA